MIIISDSKISKPTSETDLEFNLDYLIDYEKFNLMNINIAGELLKIEIPTSSSEKDNDLVIGKVYTLYGKPIEEFLNIFIDPRYRAEDLAETSLKTQEIYQILFNKVDPENFIFNQLIFVDKVLPFLEQITSLKYIKENSDFFKSIKVKPEEYFKTELDCIINFKINVKESAPFGGQNRLLLESKMFTVPLDQERRLKVLLSHLSSSRLKKYLQTRGLDYYVLMSFSYLYQRGTPSIPLCREKEQYPYGLDSIWCVHLTFINKNVLKYLDLAPTMHTTIKRLAKQLLKSIEINHHKLLDNLEKTNQIPKTINFRITYNIIKVVIMYEFLEEKEKEIKERDKALAEKDKALAELRKSNKELYKALEERDKIIEKLKQKLEERE